MKTNMHAVGIGGISALATEEQWALQQFGDQYRAQCAHTPPFVPRLDRRAQARA